VPRSLLDTADLPALRAIAAGDPADLLAATLIDTGLLQFDPDDPEWEDRDRLVVCGSSAVAATGRRLTAAGAADPDSVVTPARNGGDGLALAFGAAMAAMLDGGAWRAWCLLDADACDDGRVWEVARAAADARPETLGVLVAGGGTAGLWRACGWHVHEAPAADPVWLLGSIDQLTAAAPAVVLAVAP
jgi:transketolase N-terminal domain/subunit